jgi:hypothetical protein
VKAKPTTAAGVPTDLVVGTNTVLGRVAGDVVAAQVVDGQIATSTVTYAKIQNVAADDSFLGRISGAGGVIEELSGTQATSLLDEFAKDSTFQGVVPPSSGGSVAFLRADGTWGIPPGDGGIVTGEAASRPAADGSQGFYYATDTQVLSYDDTSVWEEVGVVADDDTLELTTDLHIKALGVDTAELQALAVTLPKLALKTDTNPGVLGYDASGVPVEIEEGAAGQVLTSAGTSGAPSFQDRDLHSRALTIESPTSAEDFSFFFTTVAITVTDVAVAVRGATPSITGTLVRDTDRSAAGTVIHTMTTVTSITGTNGAPSGDATIPADSYVWFESTAVGAATDELFIGLTFTED